MSYPEEGTIRANLKQIEGYVWKNFLPRLRKYDSVSVTFGGQGDCKGTDLSFGANHMVEIWFRTGDPVLYFDPPAWCSNRDIYDQWSYTTDLLLYWPQVKQKMESALAKLENERDALLSFSVTGGPRMPVEQPEQIGSELMLDKRKLEALEEALRDSGTTVEEQVQAYLLELYSEKVPFPVQQSIREELDGGPQRLRRSPVVRTGNTNVHRHRGECR